MCLFFIPIINTGALPNVFTVNILYLRTWKNPFLIIFPIKNLGIKFFFVSIPICGMELLLCFINNYFVFLDMRWKQWVTLSHCFASLVFKSMVRRWICRFSTWTTKTLHLLWVIFRPCKFHRSICSWLWSMCGWCIKPQAAQSSSSGSAYTVARAYTGKRKSEAHSCNVIILSD